MAAASMHAIRLGLKDRLETISLLDGRVYEFVPGTIEPPICTIVPGTFIPGDTKAAIEYDKTMANGAHEYRFTLALVVSRVVEQEAARQLDAFLATDTPESVKLAIEGDDTLGGIVSFTKVDQVIQYGALTWNNVDFFGAHVVVEVTT